LVSAVISCLWILIKDSKKSKVIWTLVIVLSILLQQLTERVFIRQSFKILIESNQEILDKVNFIFMAIPGEIMYLEGTTNSKFSKQDREIINQLFRQTNVHLIMKDSSKIFYETYGMLDARVGVSYLYSKSKTNFGTELNTFIGKWEY
jgi:hypothetical protein